MIKYRLIHTHT